MSLNATTLSAAITAQTLSFSVASATGIIAPNYTSVPAGTTIANISYLLVEQELMQVQGLNGTVVTVLRGQGGTASVPHASACPVLAGLPSDFTGFVPAQKADSPYMPDGSVGFSAPVANAATITASGPYFHILAGTTALVTINLPNYLNSVGGYPENPIAGMQIGVVFDTSSTGLTWTNAGNIAVAGTAGTAGTMVFFTYDPNISKWIPSRIL